MTEKAHFVLEEQKTLWKKRENASCQHFLLFQQCFQEAAFTGLLTPGIVWIRINSSPTPPFFFLSFLFVCYCAITFFFFILKQYFCDTKKLNSFPKRPISDFFKLKEFADDNFKFDANGRKFFKWIVNTAEKGEIAHYEQFLLFPQGFQKTCTVDT